MSMFSGPILFTKAERWKHRMKKAFSVETKYSLLFDESELKLSTLAMKLNIGTLPCKDDLQVTIQNRLLSVSAVYLQLYLEK